MNYKKMGITILCMTICALILIGALTFVIDPYFHYRKPFDFQSYSLQNQRYQNDGIARHFNYNAIITGSSMTENFMASEFDKLFSVQSIKIPYAGASFKEIDDAVERALNVNSNVKIVLRSVDHYKLFEDKDNVVCPLCIPTSSSKFGTSPGILIFLVSQKSEEQCSISEALHSSLAPEKEDRVGS